ncbi:hypothetical protein PQC38_gp061 [Aeromonas phage BUCT695]|uniref:hypothetical protein n=1 Tax=Aeromonas phage BUCT695 TaxID=2908630 RepID=UPI0023295D65|nr:hypothetical protein PQC38_gp061 [Aeromonas phage BUCT695]UIW10537.1 hypothetical protein [Aeromonas phage BUCT695]
MPLLQHIHRDMLNRVIRHDDIVVWGNGKYNQKMKIARVVGTTDQKVRIEVISENKTTLARPKNMIVISAQVQANLEGNVGANIDMEITR